MTGAGGAGERGGPGSSEAGTPASADDAGIRALVRRLVAELCDVAPDEIDADRPLIEYGLTSRDAVAISGRLEETLGTSLPATLLWQNPTVEDLARSLTTGSRGSGAGEESAPVPHTEAYAPQPDTKQPGGLLAVVGIGCRLPGGIEGPQAFWDYLIAGGDAVGEVPSDRWQDFDDGSPGTAAALARTTRWGAFLEDVAGFDADFFGITPREAELMDPQQRLLLEVAWEALDHAAVPPSSLRGTSAGVFVGLSSVDYGHLTTADVTGVTAWTATGAAASVAANRLSYLLDLQGPSMTIDTACSSSLVAVHQACRSLRSGECDLAMAAGVNVLLSPAITASFDQAGGLSPDGRCKAFDAAAGGIVRGEGCGVVVLKRLEDARRAGDTILAVIRGTAVNSDGHSAGIMAPNPAAQEALLRAALRDAGADPADVDYVEAHGTGTLLGDPIEAGALGTVLGAARPAGRPLLMGSVKSNLGHLEGAAGIVGLIKTVLSLHHRTIPASLHFRTPNPHIDFAAQHLRVVSETTSWPGRQHRAGLAGVSAFGFGGTNAHAIVQQWSPPAEESSAVRPEDVPDAAEQDAGLPDILVVSGRSVDRVGEAARSLAHWLTAPAGRQTSLEDVTHTLGHYHRGSAAAAVVGRGRQALAEQLLALADDRPKPGIVGPHETGREEQGPGRGAVFVFSGYGAQWPGMGRRLLAEDAAFAAAVEDLNPVFASQAGTRLSDLITRGVSDTAVDRIQPLLYGLQLAFARTWQAYGVEPAAVIGHSMGEVAAAVVAGALDAADGLRVMLRRSALLATVDGAHTGAMASIELPEELRAETLARFPGVEVAVYASPLRCTVAGPAEPVGRLVAELEQAGRSAHVLDVHGAGHSAAVDPVLPALRDALTGIRGAAATIRWYGTVDEDPHATGAPDAGYWCANARRPVRLQHAVAAAAADGHSIFVEISPHPIAALPVRETLEEAAGTKTLVVPTLRRGDDEPLALRASLAALHLAGAQRRPDLLWPTGRRTALPTWPWRHVRHWVGRGAARRPRADGHPLLGLRVDVPGTSRILWQGDVGTDGWNSIQRPVHGTAVMTLAACAQIIFAAAGEATGVSTDGVVVQDLALDHLLPLSGSTPVTVVWDPLDRLRAAVRLHTRSAAGTWLCHASAVVVADSSQSPATTGRAVASRHAAASQRPLLERDGITALSEPLDAGLHAPITAGMPAGAGPQQPEGQSSAAAVQEIMPVSVASLRVGRHGTMRGPSRLRRLPPEATGPLAQDRGQLPVHSRWDVGLEDGDGHPVVDVRGLTLRALEPSEVPLPLRETTYEILWDKAAVPPAAEHPPAQWLILTTGRDEASGTTDRYVAPLGAALERQGATVTARHCHQETSERILRSWCEQTEGAPAGVVLLFTEPAGPAGARGTVLAAADVARHLAARSTAASPPRLWLVTERTMQVTAGEIGDPDRACLRGLVRVLALEHPHLRTCMLDVDRAAGVADDLVRELLADSAADEVAWRGGTRFVARLTPADPQPDATAAAFARPDGAYLITGGLSGLGLATAERLAERGAGRLVLGGRRPPAPRTQDVLDGLRARGTSVEVVLGDVAVPDVAARMVATAMAEGHVLRGVAHAAGVLHDRLLTDLTPDDIDTVLRPKVEGALRLERAIMGHHLDWWLAFSSAAALLGSPGQAAYAAANAWLDAHALRRRAQGMPATSIAWGAWAQIGAAPNTAALAIHPIRPDQGLDALQLLLAGERPHTGVLRLDTRRAVQAFPGMESLPFFTDLLRGAVSDDTWGGPEALYALGAGAADAARRRLRQRAAAVMGYEPEGMDSSVPLTTLGLDSLMSVRIRNAVQQDFGIVMPSTLLLRGASLEDLGDELLAALDLHSMAQTADVGGPGSSASPRGEGCDFGAAAAAAISPADRVRPLLPTTLAPRDASERLVAGVWEKTLGRRPESLHQDLRAAGGDESVADALAAGIHHRLDATSPVITGQQILAHPTVAAIADLIRPAVNGEGSDTLRVLRSADHGTGTAPLFVFHPAGGPTSVYRPLVHLLPAHQPVYGFERVDTLASMEDKAQHYLEMMRDIQPCGPYRLLGWSFGGCLAYETASRLHDAGEPVDYLGLIDTILPAALPGTDSKEMVLERFKRFAEYIEITYGRPLRLPYEELARSAEDDQIEIVMRLVAETGLDMSPGILEHQRTSYIDARIGEHYQPQPYAGHVVLYRAQEAQVLTTALDPRYLRYETDLGWAPLCPSLEVVPVPGDHLTMIDPPHVTVIARHLVTSLQELS
ncbi:SDR family NAD(P)-dependent oxidoreductase [Streptomyces sp. RB6PN25]|uniref:SDR family NAD(P)-dependent oxidoreductase n=1 Tax=Streptomyces humicola TaxID=2953240 RepID=A0ABT1PRF5_9ACTN|nr:type I polyketide synthase [Streptomyces humicola]MCQ4079718.1 SDR family NAD(P)-dependent oxidoreductase [Streptomyces humicola]